ncbi:hypothetical protein G7Y89_g3897 [Cudoniella acicularis]|uniref:Protein kinase domain-containing protein n=1 Tax=Cudoniella acicularis TaxID=354080 RepID=A0A8H4RSM7_9HELO|nr:hypothetical protein G7Y89_g3897 [Cudoniella acicularis]
MDIAVYGKILVKTCKSYKHADQEIRESILLVETRWLKIQRQLELLRNIWPSLDEEYQIHQNGVLQVLQGKAQAATSLIDSVIGKSDDEASMQSIMSKKGETQRAKYAVSVKSSLKSVQDDLKQWSDVFDFSWYLLIRLSSKSIDQEIQKMAPISTGESEPLSTLKGLRDAISSNLHNPPETQKKTVFLPDTFFDGKNTVLEYSCSEIWPSADESTFYIVDNPSSLPTLSDICKLAKILQRVEPLGFGILSCKGVVKTPLNTDLPRGNRFVFSIPKPLLNPQSLRSLMLSSTETQALDDRFSLAKQLAKAVMFVHSSGFVHKNIRPETILIFQSSTELTENEPLSPSIKPHSTPHAFLTGFENFRLAEGITLYRGDAAWDKNLYRHPSRQGVQPEVLYSMQHDIYSLGVCLLEIGLGTSFVTYTQSQSDSEASLEPQPGLIISTAINSTIKDTRKKSLQPKTLLLVTCLTCLDKTENAFGDEDEFLDENGVLVGVRFIEKGNFSLTEETMFWNNEETDEADCDDEDDAEDDYDACFMAGPVSALGEQQDKNEGRVFVLWGACKTATAPDLERLKPTPQGCASCDKTPQAGSNSRLDITQKGREYQLGLTELRDGIAMGERGVKLEDVL